MGIIAKYKFNQNIYENFIPTFNGGFTNYTITDEIDTDGYTIRTIESDYLPTVIRFGGTSTTPTNKTISLLSVLKCNIKNITDMSYMFSQCRELSSLDLSNFNTSQVTNMRYMFRNCSSLTSLDLSNFNTSQVTNMQYMFYDCNSLTSLNVSNFDTSAVTSMAYMFGWCTKLTSLDIKNFNTHSVTNSEEMFYGIKNMNVYIGRNWTIDVSSYSNINFIKSITYLYTLAKYTFDNSIADCLPTIMNIDVNQWGYSDVIDGTITTRTIGTDEENLKITRYSFSGCTSLLTVKYLKIDTNINTLQNMFNTCSVLNTINVSNWDTSNVNSLATMFYNCPKLTSLDLSNFNTGKVNTIQAMFQNCTSLALVDLSSFDTSKVTNMQSMFQNCSKLTSLDLSNFNTSLVTSMSSMFNGCSSLTSINLSSFNTEKVSNMSGMFRGCSLLTSLDLSPFNTETLSGSLGYMFYGCKSLTSINLSSFNTEKVSGMDDMFEGCLSLTSLDLSSFNTEKVTNMNKMFYGCSSLNLLDLSNFNTKNTTNTSNMFGSCSKLEVLGMIYCDADTINKTASLLTNSSKKSIYYKDANISELTPVANVDFISYKQSILNIDEDITLRSNGNIYDELDLLTGQLTQRIAEDGSILEEEVVKQVQLSGDTPQFYNEGVIEIETNEVTPIFEMQPNFTNCYEVSSLKPNTQYTLFFKGVPTKVNLGGTVVENPTTKSLITSGEIDNTLWFDTSVDEVMLIEGDLTNRDVEYFTGVKSSQKIEVQLRGNTPYFAKGGRK